MAKGVADTVKGAILDSVNDFGDMVEDGIGDLKPGRKAAAAVAVAALAPLAAKGASKLAGKASADGVPDAVKAPGRAVSDAASGVGEKLSGGGGGVGEKLTSGVGEKISGAVGDNVEERIGEAGGPGGILTGALKNALPFGGGEDGDQGGEDRVRGTGKGRRMPVQQSVDVALPVQTVYNQWTQFEEWPQFMHRVTRASQEDPCTVSFAAKVWGKTYEFKAKIETQRPDERVKWEVTEGMTHSGWVSFHEIAPRLTRMELSLDVDPGSLIQKFARGARHVKRAARGDLHRFKAYIEALEHETGEWRGTIEDGEVVSEGESPRRSQAGSSGRSSGRRSQDGSSGESSSSRSSGESSSSRSSSGRTRSASSGESSSSRSSSGRTRSASSGESSSSRSSPGRTRSASSGGSSGRTRSASSGRSRSASGSSRSASSGSSSRGRSTSGGSGRSRSRGH